ncbi:MAG: matrixin family metalloprotease [Candidatus Nitrosocosmicus sp.]
MSIYLKLIFTFAIVLLTFALFDNTVNLTFAKPHGNNGFVNKNIIPICCAWGPELQSGILTYSIQGGDKKIDDGVTKAVNSWNKVLNGLEFEKTTGNGNIIISFINDGKKVAGKTINSIDSNGFIRQSYVTLSKKYFNHPFTTAQIDLVTKHEFGHVLGLQHANFKGNLMTSQVNTGSGTISSCVIDAVNTANAWKLEEGGVSMHGPTKKYVIC